MEFLKGITRYWFTKFENSDDIISFNKNYEGVPGNHLVNTNTKKSIDMTAEIIIKSLPLQYLKVTLIVE